MKLSDLVFLFKIGKYIQRYLITPVCLNCLAFTKICLELFSTLFPFLFFLQRKSDERESKLKKLTSNISKSMQKAKPGKKMT